MTQIGVSQRILTDHRDFPIDVSMSRSIRIEYAGALYHLMARGNRRENIFLCDDDRLFFLKTLEDACERTGWLVHAWVLMDNHVLCGAPHK